MTPLVLRGHLKVGGVDVSKQVRAFRIRGTSDIAERPPTAANPVWRPARAGQRWFLQFTLSTSPVAGTLTRMLWDAFTGTGLLEFEGALTQDPITPDNPLWTGEFLVSEWAVGGDRSTRMTETPTFRLTGAPELMKW